MQLMRVLSKTVLLYINQNICTNDNIANDIHTLILFSGGGYTHQKKHQQVDVNAGKLPCIRWKPGIINRR